MKKLQWGRSFLKVYLCYSIEDGETVLRCQPISRAAFGDTIVMRGFAHRLCDAFEKVFDSMTDKERTALKTELLKGYEDPCKS